MTNETRTRVRKPDADTAEKEAIVTEETVAEEAVAEIPQVTPTPLVGPFRRDGLNIVDKLGQKIALCGVEGDVARTGAGIAEALVQALNEKWI